MLYLYPSRGLYCFPSLMRGPGSSKAFVCIPSGPMETKQTRRRLQRPLPYLRSAVVQSIIRHDPLGERTVSHLRSLQRDVERHRKGNQSNHEVARAAFLDAYHAVMAKVAQAQTTAADIAAEAARLETSMPFTMFGRPAHVHLRLNRVTVEDEHDLTDQFSRPLDFYVKRMYHPCLNKSLLKVGVHDATTVAPRCVSLFCDCCRPGQKLKEGEAILTIPNCVAGHKKTHNRIINLEAVLKHRLGSPADVVNERQQKATELFDLPFDVVLETLMECLQKLECSEYNGGLLFFIRYSRSDVRKDGGDVRSRIDNFFG
mmetsp:Transcript_102593/g.198825  ORF Transcript_102593/g.198825 Transcript_102593/m.198825 type:complete len:315 (-) Transcript_102593:150-1094(-)